MRLRLYLALASVLLISGLAYTISIAQTGTQNVYLGDATLDPSSLPLKGSSQLKVSIATGADVPHSGTDGTPIRAVVQVIENSNFSGIQYSLDPISHKIIVPLSGGGTASIGTFTITVNTDNTKTGNISLRAALTGLENNQQGIQPISPTTKDVTLSIATPTPTPTPSPTPTPTEVAGGCNPSYWILLWCGDYDYVRCQCAGDFNKSPIIIDVNGDGYDLTDAADGVNFDLDADGVIRERVSWTAAGSDDAFLFLDRNEDGVVNNGTELFGDVTPQPYSPIPNGFAALSMYDDPRWGGNGDGVIDGFDAVYYSLRLWQDKNHNGVSEPKELHTLPELGIVSISLDYREAGRRDRYGNVFRYRAKLNGNGQSDAGRWAYDVFLQRAQ